jgi:hypothetical protein
MLSFALLLGCPPPPSETNTDEALTALDTKLKALEAELEELKTSLSTTTGTCDCLAIEGQIGELEDQINSYVPDLATLFDGLIEIDAANNVVRIVGANLQVVNGSDLNLTNDVNEPFAGLGNVIIGYNEDTVGASRTGSHNLILGTDNSYTSYGAIVSGANNQVTGPNTAVIAGTDSTANGTSSVVVGGGNNDAVGDSSVVVGGDNNTAETLGSVITGGRNMVSSIDYQIVPGPMAAAAALCTPGDETLPPKVVDAVFVPNTVDGQTVCLAVVGAGGCKNVYNFTTHDGSYQEVDEVACDVPANYTNPNNVGMWACCVR